MTKKIINNLEEFADVMVHFIANEPERLIAVFKKASDNYNGPRDSNTTGWIYQRTRSRANEFKAAISSIENSKDPVNNLQEFKKFVSSGSWKLTSANTGLYLAIIQEVIGKNYYPETPHYLHQHVILFLSEVLNTAIGAEIRRLQETRQRQQECSNVKKLTVSAVEPGIVNVSIYEDEQIAIENAKLELDSLVCRLAKTDSGWRLAWYDMRGKLNSLPIAANLKAILATIKTGSLPDPSKEAIKFSKIKQACLIAIEALLGKNQILINPDAARKEGLVSSFVITKEAERVLLDWYDRHGIKQEIDLNKYPLLKNVLEIKKLDAVDPLNLKAYLHQVDTRFKVDLSKQVNVERLLADRNKGISLIVTNTLDTVPAFRLVAGTYILTHDERGKWVLYQRQNNKNELVDTSAAKWAEYTNIIKQADAIMPSSLTDQFKNDLRSAIKIAAQLEQPSKPTPIGQRPIENKEKTNSPKPAVAEKRIGKLNLNNFGKVEQFLKERSLRLPPTSIPVGEQNLKKAAPPSTKPIEAKIAPKPKPPIASSISQPSLAIKGLPGKINKADSRIKILESFFFEQEQARKATSANIKNKMSPPVNKNNEANASSAEALIFNPPPPPNTAPPSTNKKAKAETRKEIFLRQCESRVPSTRSKYDDELCLFKRQPNYFDLQEEQNSHQQIVKG